MSWNICSYKDCLIQRRPCSSIAFFRLPQDEPRRTQWIVNSGNRQLLKLTPTQVRFFCELHFQKVDIKEQFNRKILRKHAVPKKHKSLLEVNEVEKVKIIKNKDIEEAERVVANNAEALKGENEEHKLEETVGATNEDQYVMELFEAEMLSEDEDDSYMMEYIVEYNGADEISLAAESEALLGELAEPNLAPSTTTPAPTRAPISTDCMVPALDHNEVASSEKVIKASNAAGGAEDESYLSDKHYALSLVYYLQRLGAEKKARAKIQILTYLSALDLGAEADLK